MKNQTIIIAALILFYYNIGGLATTNILRLTKGNTLTIHSSKCVCDSCGAKIPPLLQLPIISYMVCRGKCRKCGCKIPIYPLILEIVIFIGMSLISSVFHWHSIGVLISFGFYELMRICVVLIRGKRKDNFAKQYAIAVCTMSMFLLPSLFVSLLYSTV